MNDNRFVKFMKNLHLKKNHYTALLTINTENRSAKGFINYYKSMHGLYSIAGSIVKYNTW